MGGVYDCDLHLQIYPMVVHELQYLIHDDGVGDGDECCADEGEQVAAPEGLARGVSQYVSGKHAREGSGAEGNAAEYPCVAVPGGEDVKDTANREENKINVVNIF